jgi:DNA-directed RNA polymerase sigma subunit (sigma70/sigma32)
MSSQADDPVQFYLDEVAKVTPLTKDEENALFERLRRGDNPHEATARRIIEARLALVVEIAVRFASSGMPMLELLEEGNCGLLIAVKRFAANPTDDFTAYACGLIEAQIRYAIDAWNETRGK